MDKAAEGRFDGGPCTLSCQIPLLPIGRITSSQSRHEILKYHQGTSKAHTQVLQNPIVKARPRASEVGTHKLHMAYGRECSLSETAYRWV